MHHLKPLRDPRRAPSEIKVFPSNLPFEVSSPRTQGEYKRQIAALKEQLAHLQQELDKREYAVEAHQQAVEAQQKAVDARLAISSGYLKQLKIAELEKTQLQNQLELERLHNTQKASEINNLRNDAEKCSAALLKLEQQQKQSSSSSSSSSISSLPWLLRYLAQIYERVLQIMAKLKRLFPFSFSTTQLASSSSRRRKRTVRGSCGTKKTTKRRRLRHWG